MNFWEKVTGSDMTAEMKEMESRIKQLPVDYQTAWEEIKAAIWPHTDFSGRNLMPIFEGVLGFLEESASEELSVKEALGENIQEFCAVLTSETGAKSYRDKWRDQLNRNVVRKLKNWEESK